jgi:methionyl-tRNA formyltransferase
MVRPPVAPPRPRLVFMGTPEYAVPSLRRVLVQADVVAVFTQPDRPAGRGLEPRASCVRRVAEEAGVRVLQPASLRRDPAAVAALQELRPDVVVVAAYGLVLPAAALEAAGHGCLNVHASLLPRWRGAAPVQHAIAAGDPRTGVSIMLMEEALDSGPVLAQADTPISPCETTGELTGRLADLGAELLAATLPAWMAGRLQPRPQDEGRVTWAPRLSTADGRLDWTAAAQTLERRVRAMNPWPGAWTDLPDGRRLKILAASVARADGPPAPTGTVLEVGGLPQVACGAGRLALDSVQPAGRRAMSGRDFLRGARSLIGQRLAAGPRPERR